MEAYITEELLTNTFLYCYKRITDKEVARDVAQDILMYAMMAIKQNKKIDNFFAWYWQMANHKVVDYYRRGKKIFSLDEIKLEPSYKDHTLESLISEEEITELSFALTRLAAIHRDIIIRFYLQEQTVAKIAADLNIPVGTVKGRLFDARKNLHKRIEKMKKEKVKRDVDIFPIDFSFYWMAEKEMAVINSNLRAQILKSVRMEKKSINEIADDIGASPVYIESDIKVLKEVELILEPIKGKYIADICLFPKTAINKTILAQKKVFKDLNLGKRFYDVVFALKDKFAALEFYGNNFDYDYLLWFYVAYLSKMFITPSREYIKKKYASDFGDRKFRYSFVSGIYYENIKQYNDKSIEPLSTGYPYLEYTNAKYGNFAFHDTLGDDFEMDKDESGFINGRLMWVNEVNAQLVFDLLDNPKKVLSLHEQEMAADLISKGVLTKSENGFEFGIPVFTHDVRRIIEKSFMESANQIAVDFAEKMYPLLSEYLLPYVRDELKCAYYNFVVPKYLGLTKDLLQYGIENKYLIIPKEIEKSTCGLAIMKGQKTIVKE